MLMNNPVKIPQLTVLGKDVHPLFSQFMVDVFEYMGVIERPVAVELGVGRLYESFSLGLVTATEADDLSSIYLFVGSH